jgi:hypothetical protein
MQNMSLEQMIDTLTMPYNPRTYYYFLIGAGQRVDLMREGYVITKEHRYHVRPSRHFTKAEVRNSVFDLRTRFTVPTPHR